jgi:DNA-binding NarL/FixJ family response regulator
MERARLLLGEDHAAVAEQLRELLEPEFEVIGIVQDGCSLVAAAAALRPDVVITAAAEILSQNPEARVIFVTVHNEPGLADRAMAIGALGYVVKVAAGDELVPAVRAALNGQRYLCTRLRRPPA